MKVISKDNIPWLFIFLAFLVLGFLIGQSIGATNCNKHYQSEEVQEDIYDNYVLKIKQENKILSNVFNFSLI